jgi:arsenate reductase
VTSHVGKKRVLFVCIGNSCRSQIAEALARHHASDVIEPASAGISPLGSIAESTRKILLERGVRVAADQYSKGLREADPDGADLIVNMTGMPGLALFAGAEVVDWDIDDPYGEDLGVYRRVCDDIEELVQNLAAVFRKGGVRPVPR